MFHPLIIELFLLKFLISLRIDKKIHTKGAAKVCKRGVGSCSTWRGANNLLGGTLCLAGLGGRRKLWIPRSSRLQMFFKKGVWAFNFIERRFRHRCFPVNIAKFLRAAFFIEHLRWMAGNSPLILNH